MSGPSENPLYYIIFAQGPVNYQY